MIFVFFNIVQAFLSQAKTDFQKKWDNPEQVNSLFVEASISHGGYCL